MGYSKMGERGCRRLWDLLVCSLIFVGDRATKHAALSYLSYGVSVPIGHVLGVDCFLTLTTNEGAAWGAMDQFPTVLLCFRLAFVVGLGALYLLAHVHSLVRTFLAVVLAGALGNICDTLLWGHVVDMIHLVLWGWDYPVFNVADVAICVGSLALVWSTLRVPHPPEGG